MPRGTRYSEIKTNTARVVASIFFVVSISTSLAAVGKLAPRRNSIS